MTHQEMEIRLKELEKRIKTLEEQEPFMNKSCVTHQVCHEDKIKILDKIIAEIAEEHNDYVVREQYDTAYGLKLALGIIDKYTRDSEDKE